MKAYELLANPSSWTKKAYARNKGGHICLSNDSRAVKWCMIGAIERCYPDAHHFLVACEKVCSLIGTKVCSLIGTTGWNDAPERTHEEVVTLLKKADV